MARCYKPVLILSLAALFLFAAFGVGAQQSPPFSKPYPIGQVDITLKAVGAGVGLEWGRGILTYEGKQYTFKIRGIKVGTVGITEAHAKGDVYNLFSITEFPGHYVAAGAGLAVFKGKEGQAFKNSRGVHILLKSAETGLALNIGADGFTVRLEEAL
jgi:outer membrane immunogenic protein